MSEHLERDPNRIGFSPCVAVLFLFYVIGMHMYGVCASVFVVDAGLREEIIVKSNANERKKEKRCKLHRILRIVTSAES